MSCISLSKTRGLFLFHRLSYSFLTLCLATNIAYREYISSPSVLRLERLWEQLRTSCIHILKMWDCPFSVALLTRF